jgi:abortive infection bacteriophage resistance protein
MKEFKTYRQQLRILRNRGLIVPTNGKPMQILREENYYALINGYKEPFLGSNPSAVDQSETYIPGSEFDEIYSLYVFDRNIRAIILRMILKIESQFKSYLSYEFSKVHGSENYLKTSSFNDTAYTNPNRSQYKEYESRIEKINQSIAKINNAIAYSYRKKDYIKHHINKYGAVPMWVLVNSLTMGNISVFFSLMKPQEQIAISQNYQLMKENLNRYMKVLSEVRNICAHDERLYNIKLKKESEIRDTNYHNLLSIPMVQSKYVKGKKDFLAVLISIKDVTKKREYGKLITEIESEIDKLSPKLISISINDIKDKMGLPTNWTQLRTL